MMTAYPVPISGAYAIKQSTYCVYTTNINASQFHATKKDYINVLRIVQCYTDLIELIAGSVVAVNSSVIVLVNVAYFALIVFQLIRMDFADDAVVDDDVVGYRMSGVSLAVGAEQARIRVVAIIVAFELVASGSIDRRMVTGSVNCGQEKVVNLIWNLIDFDQMIDYLQLYWMDFVRCCLSVSLMVYGTYFLWYDWLVMAFWNCCESYANRTDDFPTILNEFRMIAAVQTDDDSIVTVVMSFETVQRRDHLHNCFELMKFLYLHHNVLGAYCRPANCIYYCYCSLKYPNLSHFHCFDRSSDAMSPLIQFGDLLKLVLRQLTENLIKKKFFI